MPFGTSRARNPQSTPKRSPACRGARSRSVRRNPLPTSAARHRCSCGPASASGAIFAPGCDHRRWRAHMSRQTRSPSIDSPDEPARAPYSPLCFARQPVQLAGLQAQPPHVGFGIVPAHAHCGMPGASWGKPGSCQDARLSQSRLASSSTTLQPALACPLACTNAANSSWLTSCLPNAKRLYLHVADGLFVGLTFDRAHPERSRRHHHHVGTIDAVPEPRAALPGRRVGGACHRACDPRWIEWVEGRRGRNRRRRCCHVLRRGCGPAPAPAPPLPGHDGALRGPSEHSARRGRCRARGAYTLSAYSSRYAPKSAGFSLSMIAAHNPASRSDVRRLVASRAN